MRATSQWLEVARVCDSDPPPGPEDPAPQASVAVILTPSLEVLLIQRAAKETDPWSGHMAFPGGRCEPDDGSPRLTAMRETSEEVGLDLGSAEPLGRLSSVDGSRATGRPLLISAHVFGLDAKPTRLVPNYEVATTTWMPVHYLADPQRSTVIHHQAHDQHTMSFPAIRLDGDLPVLWGLTLGFLTDLTERLGINRQPAKD